MSRLFTALKDGKVARRGTFDNEELLRLDLPSPEYTLIFDEHLEFETPKVGYREYRRAAYPPLSEFADAMYWQSQGDGSKMEAYNAAVAAVKAQFPKSN